MAFQQLVERHEILRIFFHIVNEQVVQKIHREIELDFVQVVVSDQNIESLLTSFMQPFDLEQAPLFRVRLIHLQKSQSLLWLIYTI